MKALASALALGAAIGLLAGGGASQAAELWIMTTMGPSTGVFELAAGFERATKNKVTVTFESGSSLEQKLQSNAPADLLASGPDQVEDLMKKGKIVDGTNTPFGLAGLGASVKAGAPPATTNDDAGTSPVIERNTSADISRAAVTINTSMDQPSARGESGCDSQSRLPIISGTGFTMRSAD